MIDNNLILNKVLLLNWDSDFFGFPICRLNAHLITEAKFRGKINSALKKKMEFFELFCDVSDSKSIFSFEKTGCQLADIRLSYKKELNNPTIFELPGYLVFKRAECRDITRLKVICNGLFSTSRYYYYPGFNKRKIDLMFQLWAEKSVMNEFDNEVYCLFNEKEIIGFCSVKYTQESASMGLLGVHSDYHGNGYGDLIVKNIFSMLLTNGVKEVTCTTQGRNSVAQNLFQKNYFNLTTINLNYYKWLL